MASEVSHERDTKLCQMFWHWNGTQHSQRVKCILQSLVAIRCSGLEMNESCLGRTHTLEDRRTPQINFPVFRDLQTSWLCDLFWRENIARSVLVADIVFHALLQISIYNKNLENSLKSFKENLNFVPQYRGKYRFLWITSLIGASSLSLNNCKEAAASSSRKLMGSFKKIIKSWLLSTGISNPASLRLRGAWNYGR